MTDAIYTIEPELLDDHEDPNFGGLTIFDMDDTLFTSHACVNIRDEQDKIVTRLDGSDPKLRYRSYPLQDGHYYCYNEFRSSQVFRETSKPIERMINRAYAILHHIAHRPKSRVIILTARDNFDDQELFFQALREHGLDTNKVAVEFAGELDLPAPEAKAIITHQYLDQGSFDRVRIFDDHLPNLVEFLRLRTRYPTIEFSAYQVIDGDIIQFENTQ